MNTPKSSIETLAFGGTLGDAFIVLCKLYCQYKTNGKHFRLIRYCLHPGMDAVIKKMFETVPFIEYITPCEVYNDIEDLNKAIKNTKYKYICTKWQKRKSETYAVDYENLDPFPLIDLKKPDVSQHSTNIGIQLYCGTEGHNFRGFSLNWLKAVRKFLPLKKFTIYLFGTTTKCYQGADIERICTQQDIVNMVGKTDFSEWMSFIKAMDCFISLEGFSAFFAMSQRIPTLVFNQYIYSINNSVHPLWAKDNIIININSNRFLSRIRYFKATWLGAANLYSPRNSYLVRDFIKKNT
jgi:hypothetical protein